MRRHLYSLFGFTLGLLAGWLLSARSGSSPESKEALPAAEMKVPAPGPMPVFTQKEAASGEDPGVTAALERLAALRRLNGVLRRKFFLPFQDYGFVSDNFVQVFGLTLQQRDAIDALIEEAQRRMEAVEVRSATISLAPDGKAKISVPAYPKEGAALYDEFFKNLNQIMGDERFGYLQDLCADAVEGNTALHYFGIESRSYLIADSHDLPQHGWMSSGSSWDDQTGWRSRSFSGDLHWLASEHPELYEKVLASTGWAPLPADQIHRFPRTRPVIKR